MPKTIIVDSNDHIIGYKERKDIRKEEIYRVSALWITNSKGEILLAQRHHSKSHHPGLWATAVAGTVEEGETYESNIIKEAGEEIGLFNIQPTLGPKVEITGEYHHFTQWFFLEIDRNVSEFILEENQVEAIQWFSPEDLKHELLETPEKFIPSMPMYFQKFSQTIL